MANYCEVDGLLVNGLKVNCLSVRNGSTLKVQANTSAGSTLSYVVKGCLKSNGDIVTVAVIRDSDFEMPDKIVDNSIYTCSVSGYSYVTVEPTDNTVDTKIYGKIMCE